MCQIYVDDIIFGSTNQEWCEEFSKIMAKRFEISMMGELKFFLRFQIKQLKDGTFICQTKYTKDMLKKFDMENAKPIKTPMPTNGHLDLNEDGKGVDQKEYRSMIGSLLYLCASRPDIMLSVCMGARFQANPKESHLMAVKRILRYLFFTRNLGSLYPKGFTWLFQFRLCQLQGRSKEYNKDLPIPWPVHSVLELYETKFHCAIHHRGRVCCSRCLLCSTTLDEANLE